MGQRAVVILQDLARGELAARGIGASGQQDEARAAAHLDAGQDKGPGAHLRARAGRAVGQQTERIGGRRFAVQAQGEVAMAEAISNGLADDVRPSVGARASMAVRAAGVRQSTCRCSRSCDRP